MAVGKRLRLCRVGKPMNSGGADGDADGRVDERGDVDDVNDGTCPDRLNEALRLL
jgi:hypothetical protein